MASLGRFVLLGTIAVATVASCTLDFDEPFSTPQSDAGLDSSIGKEGGLGGHAGTAASGGVAGKGGKGGASGAGGKGGSGSGGKGGVGGTGGVGGAGGLGGTAGASQGGAGGQGGGPVGGQGGVGAQGGSGQGGTSLGGQGGGLGGSGGLGYGGSGGFGGGYAGWGGSGWGGWMWGGAGGAGGSSGIGGQGGGEPGPCESSCGVFCGTGKSSASCTSCWQQGCHNELDRYGSDSDYETFDKCVQGCSAGPQCVENTCCPAHPAACVAWFSVWTCSCGYISSSCVSACTGLCAAGVLTGDCVDCAALSPCGVELYDYMTAPDLTALTSCIQNCGGNPNCSMMCCQGAPQACMAWQDLSSCVCSGF